MITSGQLRAARALLRMDRQTLAIKAGLSMPTIQRMESGEGVVRGNVESLVKIVNALRAEGIELIVEGQKSQGQGRGIRFIETTQQAGE